MLAQLDKHQLLHSGTGLLNQNKCAKERLYLTLRTHSVSYKKKHIFSDKVIKIPLKYVQSC